MPPAIIVGVVAAAGAYAAGAALLTAAFIGIMAATITQSMTKKPNAPGTYRDTSERKQVLRAAAAPEVVAYGTTISAGTLFFASEQAGDQTEEWIHLAIALCNHPVEGVDTIYIGDDDISTFPTTNVTWEIHQNRTTADPFMVANCAQWTSDMIGQGITWLRISLKYDQELFPSGLPNIKVKKKNKKLYDPRTGTTSFSNNAALAYLDYFRDVMKVPDSELNMEEFKTAADICDEMVGNADGTASRRYTVDGEFDMDEARNDVIVDLLQACGGEPTYRGGKHGIMVAAYYGPATMTLSQKYITDSIKIVPEVSYKERVNTITGTYISMDQGFTEVDFPSVVISEWFNEDGETFAQDFKFRFVTNPYTAQRLANITVKRLRQGRTIEIPTNMTGYQFRPGLNCVVDIPVLGITGTEFKVTKWTFGLADSIVVTLRQDNAAMYGDAVGVIVDNPPLVNIPVGGVAQPTNLVYTVQEIGQVVQGVLTWENTGNVAYNQVVIRDSNNAIVTSAQVPGTLLNLTGLLRGVYTAHVVAIGINGRKSPEGYLQFNIAAPDAPSSVNIAMGYFQATLTPRLAQLQNVSTQFDFWTSGETALANTQTATVEANATRLFMGTQYTTPGTLAVDHTYYYYVRTINAFGSSNFVQVAVTYVLATAALIDIINNNLQNTQAFKNLTQSAEDNYQAIIENALAGDSDTIKRYKEVVALDVKLSASIEQTNTILVNNNISYAQQMTVLNANFQSLTTTTNASITEINRVVADANSANALRFTQVEASINDTNAVVQETASAYADLSGKLSAQWGVKVQVTSGGVKYIAGMQLGVEGNGGDIQSVALFTADTFGIYNPSSGSQKLAFAVKSGQVFIAEGIFDYTSITLAKLGSWYSSNYVAGSSGTIMRSDGSFEFYGNPGTGRFVLDSRGAAWYNTSSQLVCSMGASR